jgi:hypothetical protein
MYKLPFVRQHPDQTDCDMFSVASSTVQDNFDQILSRTEVLSGTEVFHETMSSSAGQANCDINDCENTTAHHIESDKIVRAHVPIGSQATAICAECIEVEAIKSFPGSLTKADGDLESETMALCCTGHIKVDITSIIHAAIDSLVVADNAEHDFYGDSDNTASRHTGVNEMDCDILKSSKDSLALADTDFESRAVCSIEQVESNCDILSSFNDSFMTAGLGRDQVIPEIPPWKRV